MTTKRHLIYLPGFMGTELTDLRSRSPVWNIELSLLNQLKGLDRESLPGKFTLAGKPLRLVYRAHLSSLRRAGYNVHWFGFDWRAGLLDHLDRLRQFIATEVGNENFQLLGHSTGGLLGLLFLSDQSTRHRCQGYVGFGVPVEGVDYLADFLLYGDDRLAKLEPVLELSAIRRRLMGFQSIFDLMPAELLRQPGRHPLAHLATKAVDLERSRLARAQLDSALKNIEASDVPVTFLTQTHQRMRRCQRNASSLSFEIASGDGWISTERSFPAWSQPIEVEMRTVDYAAAGLFALFSRVIAAHPFQPLYPSVRQAIEKALMMQWA